MIAVFSVVMEMYHVVRLSTKISVAINLDNLKRLVKGRLGFWKYEASSIGTVGTFISISVQLRDGLSSRLMINWTRIGILQSGRWEIGAMCHDLQIKPVT